MSDLDLDRLEALRAAAADHKCEEETGYMHPCPRAEFSLAVHETFPALLRAAREKEAYLDRAEQDEVAMMRALDLRDKFAAEVVVATQRAEQAEALWNEHTSANDCLRRVWDAEKRAEQAENLRDQFEARALAAETGEGAATQRAEQAEARAEKWKALAVSAHEYARIVTTEQGDGIDWSRYFARVSALAAENTTTRPEHVCTPSDYCRCRAYADEPSEDCTIHGGAPNNRCACGKFVARPEET